MIRNWWSKVRAPGAASMSKPRRNFCRPVLERLETRTLPSNVYQTLLGDVGDLNKGDLQTLQSGISSALDTLQNIPFLSNNLGSMTKALLVTQGLINDLSGALGQIKDPNPDPTVADPLVKSTLLGSGLTALKDVQIAHPHGSDTLELQLHLQDPGVVQKNFNFNMNNLGLPGLPIQVTANAGLNVQVGYDLELAFGYDPQQPNALQDGFFIDTAPKLPNAQFPNNQLIVSAGVSLDNTSQLSVNLGMLKAKLTDDAQQPTTFVATFTLASLSFSNPQPHYAVDAALSLDATTDFGNPITVPSSSVMPTSVQFQMPQITAHFIMSWNASDIQGQPNSLDVQFKDVGVDLGSLIGSFVGPVVEAIQGVTKQIEPIINFMTSPIPGISDFSHLIGQGDVNLLDILKQVAPDVFGPEAEPVFDALAILGPLVNKIDKLNISGTTITLGSFDLDSAADQNQLKSGTVDFSKLTIPDAQNLGDGAASLVPQTAAGAVQTITDVEAQLPQGTPQVVTDVLNSIGSDLQSGYQFNFPVLDHPAATVFSFLLGNNPDLFDFTAKIANASTGGKDAFSGTYFGTGISFETDLTVDGYFRVAYDTYGVREFLNSGDATKLLDGLYLDPSNHITISGTIGPKLSFGEGIASISLNGGLMIPSFTITFDNSQNLSRLRFSDLIKQSCFFDGLGEIDAGLSITVQLGVNIAGHFFGIEHDFPIAQVTLFSYPTKQCLGSAPVPNVDLGDVVNGVQVPSDPLIVQNGVLTPSEVLENGVLVVHLGDKGLQDFLHKTDQHNEVVEISEHQDPNTVNTYGNESVDITADGITQTRSGVHYILVDASGLTDPPDLTNETVTIDGNVLDDAGFFGGPGVNTFSYFGSGNAYLIGGPGSNDFTGGRAKNYLRSGSGNSATDILIGGRTASGKRNTIVAGSVPTQLVAGPNSNDVLLGGTGTDAFFAGAGMDTMTGGAGDNTYNWQEGNGDLTVNGAGLSNKLNVVASQAGDSLVASTPGPNTLLVQLSKPNANNPFATLSATDIQVLSLDDSGGNAAYTVNDLLGAGIQNVNVNLHEVGSPDGTANSVTENVDTGPATVTVDAADGDSGKHANNDPTQPDLFGEVTNTDVVRNVIGVGGNGGPVTYHITAAIPNETDQLTLNTHGGPDTIYVLATQSGGVSTLPTQIPTQPGGQVTVNTYTGNDILDIGFYTLDHFFGPLNLVAQSGSADVLKFDESSSLVQDVDRLSSNQLVRYSQPPTVTSDPGPDQRSETAYPFVINFLPAGGTFSPGMFFNTSRGGTNLYIPETGPNLFVTVGADGNQDPNAPDHIFVGFDGANDQNATTVEGVPINSPFPPTVAKSTLDLIASPVRVNVATNLFPMLEADDVGASSSETYTVRILYPPAIPTGLLLRTGAEGIAYSPGVHFTLNAGKHGNAIAVQGVESNTTATINAGHGGDTITVGNVINRLDDISGPLTINGQAGTNTLTIHDDGTLTPQSYQLSATQLARDANQQMPAVVITFAHVASIAFDASNNPGLNSINVIGTPAGVPVDINPGNGMASLDVGPLDQIQGALTFDWNQGLKDLFVNDFATAAAETYHLSPGQLKRTHSALIQFGTLAGEFVFAGFANPADIRVGGTPATTPLTLVTGTSQDQVEISRSQKDLDNIAATVEVDGGGATELDINDQNHAGRTYQLDIASLQTSGGPADITFHGLDALVLNAGRDATVNVLGTQTKNNVQVNLNKGASNQVNVGSTSNTLDTINGPVVVSGKTGNDPLAINDQNGPAGDGYTITTSSIANGFSKPIQFQNMGRVTLNGGKGIEFYTVQSVPTTPVTIVAQGFANELVGPDTDTAWQISGADSASVGANVQFQGIQNLLGGLGNDIFGFQNGGSISGTIDGGLGTNTLDYSAYVGTVIVDLPLGAASLVQQMLPGGVHEIQNATGGQGNALLVGDGQANALSGGTGRNVEIGGGGADSVSAAASNDDNLLIGGRTQWDLFLPALEAILAEWSRTDLGFADRLGDLATGSNSKGAIPLNIVNNNLILLTKSTVSADGAPDTLIGGAAGTHNWFFVDALDTILNFKKSRDVRTDV